MPINPKYKAKYVFEGYYHVFNRSSSSQLMFMDDDNYPFFLAKFNQYLGAYSRLIARCLVPNHFHLLIQIKAKKDIPPLPKNKTIDQVLTRQFKNFFISYSLSLKSRYQFKGNIFSQKYKHVRLYNPKDIRQVILYIHRNPKHHRVGLWNKYIWSSYIEQETENFDSEILKEVFELFGGKEAFKKAHLAYMEQGSEPLKGSEP